MSYTIANDDAVVEPRIALVGVGGAGCNIITELHNSGCDADTVAINADKESLDNTLADRKLYICKGVLKGQGARGDATVGRNCADAHRVEIEKTLEGYDFVFVFAGLGGGTGSGATPVVLNYAKAVGANTYTIAVSPFMFEGSRRNTALHAYQMIKGMCPDTMLVDNNLILQHLPNLKASEAFTEVNKSIARYIKTCIETIRRDIRVSSKKIHVETEDRYKVEEYPLANVISA